MTRAGRLSLLLLPLFPLAHLLAPGPAGAARVHCRDVVMSGAAGAASNDRLQLLVAAWGDGSGGVLAPCPDPNPPAPPPKTSCGNQPLGTRSCKHKYKFKPDRATLDPDDGLIRIRICCKDGALCRGKNMASPKTPVSVQSKVDPSVVFEPPVPPVVGAQIVGVSVDPIDMTQLPAGEMLGCRKKLGIEVKKRVAASLGGRLKGLPPDLDPAATLRPVVQACAEEGASGLALGYAACPVPCQGIPVSRCTQGLVGAPCAAYAECDTAPGAGDGVCTVDWNLVADCLACQIETALDAAYGEVFPTGTGDTPEAERCEAGLGKALLGVVTGEVNETVRCQRLLDAGAAALPTNPAGQCLSGQCLAPPLRAGAPCDDDVDCNVPPTCKRSDLIGRRAAAAERAAARIAADCTDDDLALLDTCDVDVNGAAECVTEAAQAAARAVADAAFPEGRASP
jgi:hypothetical protein